MVNTYLVYPFTAITTSHLNKRTITQSINLLPSIVHSDDSLSTGCGPISCCFLQQLFACIPLPYLKTSQRLFEVLKLIITLHRESLRTILHSSSAIAVPFVWQTTGHNLSHQNTTDRVAFISLSTLNFDRAHMPSIYCLKQIPFCEANLSKQHVSNF